MHAFAHTLLLDAYEFAQSGGGDDGEEERGGKSERLQRWDHVIAMAVESGLRISD